MRRKHEDAFVLIVAVIFTAVVMVLVVALINPDYLLKLVDDEMLKSFLFDLLSSLIILL